MTDADQTSGKAMLLMTTVDSDEQVETLCRVLLDEHLAACIQALPVTSRYRWQGVMEQARETLLLIKTSAAATGAAIETVRRHHSYDTPEVVALPIDRGLPAYLQWIARETGAPG